jgi:hypothetical protein
MKKVTKEFWETEDGKLFETKKEANKHDSICELGEIFHVYSSGGEIDLEIFISILEEYPEEIKNILNAISN